MTFSIEQLGEIDNVVGKWCVARVPELGGIFPIRGLVGKLRI
jgi:hypothetical protein